MAPRHRIVLLGPGHTHVEVLRRWRTAALPGVSLTCVADHADATYSGMLPGVLAGQYGPCEMRIPLGPLCASVGAGLVVGQVVRLERTGRLVHLEAGPPLPYDLLSIGVGSVPGRGALSVADAAPFVPVKPMQTFLARLEQALGRGLAREGPARIVVVGGGAGGIEIALTMGPTVSRIRSSRDMRVTLVTAAPDLAPGRLAATARRVRRVFDQRGATVITGRRVIAVGRGTVRLDDERTIEADAVIWATDAVAAPLLARLDLPRDDRGFLLTTPTLQSVGDPRVLAVGDAGTIVGAATPKAGVHAVRQGPVLWDNLNRLAHDQPPRAYDPQADFLKLLNTGDGRAIGEWRGWSFEGAWCWRLKDAIDRRFIRRYQALARTPGDGATPASSAAPP